MLEYLIVGLIVAAAAFYAVRKFMPAGLRRRLTYKLGGADTTLGKMMNTDSGCGSGCNTCKSCEEPDAKNPDDPRIIRIHKS